MRPPVTIGVVGLGYWGPNLARTFAQVPRVEIRWLCDSSPDVRLSLPARFPGARVTADFDELLDDDDLTAVVIATPSSTHADLVERALDAEKHVFVEKPLALSAERAHRLVRHAENVEEASW